MSEDWIEALPGDCDSEQLAAAGVLVEVDDSGEFYCVWAATGEPLVRGQRVHVPPRAEGAPVPEKPLSADLLDAEEPLVLTRPRRSRRPVVGAALALTLFSGTGAGLVWALGGDPAPAAHPLRVRPPAVTAPVVEVPVSTVAWSEKARARLAEVDQRLIEAQAAADAWAAMPADRREGVQPPEVGDLQVRLAELRQQRTALATDLAALEALRADVRHLTETQEALTAVEGALSSAPPSEVVPRLTEQREMLATQVGKTQESVQLYQEGLAAAASVPLPEVPGSEILSRIRDLTEQPADPTPDPVEEAALAARAEDVDPVREVEEEDPAPEPTEDPVVAARTPGVEVTVPEVVTPVTGLVEDVVPETAAPVLDVLPPVASRPEPVRVSPVEVTSPAPVQITVPASVAEPVPAEQAVGVVAARAGECGREASGAPVSTPEQQVAMLEAAGQCLAEAFGAVSARQWEAVEQSVTDQVAGMDLAARSAPDPNGSSLSVDKTIKEISPF